MENTENKAPSSFEAKEAEVIEGEVVGYDIQSLIGNIGEAVIKCVDEHYLSENYGKIILSLLSEWGSQMAQAGISIINME